MKQILNNLTDFLKKECEVWQKADKAFQDLNSVKSRTISSSGLRLQFNPSRIVSKKVLVVAPVFFVKRTDHLNKEPIP